VEVQPSTTENREENMRKNLIVIAGLAGFAFSCGTALAENAPGITDSEILIGNTAPYSGPASIYSVAAKAMIAYFQMINDQGGINGRKISIDSIDDGYSPPKTVEQTRKLVEKGHVAFMFGSVGTPTNVAVRKYLNDLKVPQLFVGSGADFWGDYQHYPWSIGFLPSYRVEAQIYAKYILGEKPNGKIAVLYQNDDFGMDYLNGLKDIFGDDYGKHVIKEASYETTEPTIDSQIVSLQCSGANVLVTAAVGKFGSQAIRKVHDIGWRPLHFITYVSTSVGASLQPAGLEKSIGLITALYGKDPTNPEWKNDPGMNEWRAFMVKYLPSASQNDVGFVVGYHYAETLAQVLKQCGNDLSRHNIMRQAANLHGLHEGLLLPGITINTSPTDFHPIKQMRLARFDGETWVLFGEIIVAK
jgi:branched-chain amino acid transport system substrate-binding protein